VTMLLAYGCSFLGTTVLQITLSLFGLLGGPLLAVFSLGMFIPFANSYGAFIGLISSLFINITLGIGSVFYGIPIKTYQKPFNTTECQGFNETFIFSNSSSTKSSDTG
jgi:solute carrier family 5 (sodium-coupled monocarboxylate transporter), member 8/12